MRPKYAYGLMGIIAILIVSSVLSLSATEITMFGFAGTKPILKDYDGDGALDLIVYYDLTGTWYILGTKVGYQQVQWGFPGTIPVMEDYDHDGMADIGIYHPASGGWYLSAYRTTNALTGTGIQAIRAGIGLTVEKTNGEVTVSVAAEGIRPWQLAKDAESDPIYQSEKSMYITGCPVFVESDPIWNAQKSQYATGTPLYAYTESDPVYAADKSTFATGTPVYVESDPVWASASNLYVMKDELAEIPYENTNHPSIKTIADALDLIIDMLDKNTNNTGCATNMLAYYNFNDNGTNVAYDITQHGFDANVHNAAWVTEDVDGGAYQFDGSNSYLSAMNIPYSFSNTIAGWVNFDKANQDGFVWSWGNVTGTKAHIGVWHMNTGNYNLQFCINHGTEYCIDSGILPEPGRWHHVAAAWDSSDMIFYVDGIETGRRAQPLPENLVFTDYFSTHLGRAQQDAGSLQGTIDDFRIYCRTLSSNEIFTLASQYTNETSDISTNLLLYYNMDSNEVTTITDDSTNGYTGDIYGSYWTNAGISGGAFYFDGIKV